MIFKYSESRPDTSSRLISTKSLLTCHMHSQKFLFVGGSQEGLHPAPAAQVTLTFVDGDFVQPTSEGVYNAPLNATLETYILEPVEDQECSGETQHAYFLAGLDALESQERFVRVKRKYLQNL
ncbi:MAG: hypothetical protein QM680_08735 [Luteolibacter sp.]